MSAIQQALASYKKIPSTLLNWLIAYWKMEWNSTDSVWSNNGTDTGITYASGNGKISQGAGFNGTTSRIQMPTNTFLNWQNTLTLNTWITFNDHLTGALRWVFWNQWNYVGGFNSQYISTNGVDQTVAFATTGTTPWVTPINIWSITTGQWYMLTHTFDTVAKKVEVFLDWVSKWSQTFTTLPAIAVSTVQDIGRVYDTSRIHNGNMDEFAIWNRVLTGAEITALYNWWSGVQHPF